MRRCAYTRCPRLIPNGERYCNEHKRARDHERGSSTQRGYGSAHQRERAQWWQRMAAGEPMKLEITRSYASHMSDRAST